MDRFDWIELEGGAHPPSSPSAKRETAFKRVQPHDAPSYVAAAHEMRAAGHWNAAAEYFRKAVGLDDHDYAAWAGLVDSLVRARKLASADAASAEALDNYRQVRALYAARGLVLGRLGKLSEAFAHSEMSVDGGDTSWYARCVRGDLILKAGEAYLFDALDCFDQGIALAEKPWEACLLSGVALLDAKVPVLAASFLADAAHHNPRAAVSWLYLGDSFRELRLFDQAVFYYQRVVELEPTHEGALARQKECHPRLFGLMSAFRRPDLRERWRKEFDEVLQREGR